MKRVLIAAASALALTACATATPYQPAGPYASSDGFRESRIESNRFRVSFAGNSLTSRDTVEMYLLFRAAELTLQNGYDWFAVADRDTDANRRLIASPDPFGARFGYADPFFYPRYGRFWGPSWRYYGPRGAWSPWSPYFASDFDVREVTRYEATAEVIMGRGPKPGADVNAFDAREVVENLRPRVRYPESR